jgi:hypothetical protein
VAAVKRQGRHDLSNFLGATIAGLTREMRELEHTSVRREDMKALEDRVNGRFDKLDRTLDRVLERTAVVAAGVRAAE